MPNSEITYFFKECTQHELVSGDFNVTISGTIWKKNQQDGKTAIQKEFGNPKHLKCENRGIDLVSFEG